MIIGLVRLGYGNIYNVVLAISKICNATVEIWDKLGDIKCVDYIIFPGVGSMQICFASLKQIDMLESVKRMIINNKCRYLGICLGSQMLFNYNYEGKQNGMGVLIGNICIIKEDRVPHIGWNTVCFREGMGKEFYFSHSFFINEKFYRCYITKYRNHSFPSVIYRKRLCLTQFHPEVSGYWGWLLIRHILLLCVK
ncbi:imidazole glycerol phosphate synthase subunit HisH [Candidatus Vidania fulgoroideorum]